MKFKAIKGIMLLILFACALTLASIQLAKTQSAVIVVPSDFPRIQDAINAAKPGDTIQVSAGTYHENIVVNKTVSLIGEDKNKTIIDGGGVGTVVNVTANDVVITGFTIRNSGQEAGYSRYTDMDSGIVVHLADKVSIFDNLVMNNADGIRLLASRNVNVSSNIAENNTEFGILLWNSTFNVLRNNSMFGNKYNFGVWATITSAPTVVGEYFVQDIDTSNTVNGKPIYYWTYQHDKSVPADAGFVALVNCTGITIMDLNLSSNFHSVDLMFSENSIIRNVNATNNSATSIYMYNSTNNVVIASGMEKNGGNGIVLFMSDNNTITGNTAMNNTGVGIYTYNSIYNNIVNNQAMNNSMNGIMLGESDNNTITGNTATNNGGNGIALDAFDNNNIITGNTAMNNTYHGIAMWNSLNNIVEGNVAANNTWQGIGLWNSHNNTISSNWAENNADNGFWLYNSTYNAVAGNWARNNTHNGVYLMDSSSNTVIGNWASYGGWDGIALRRSHNNTISNTTAVNNTGQGIGLWDSLDNAISSNVAERNMGSGIFLSNSTYNAVAGNWAMNNSNNGVYLMDSSSNTVIGNWASYGGWDGIALRRSHNNTIGSNTAVNNTGQGIGLWDSFNNTVRSNVAEKNLGNGIYLSNSSDNTVVSNRMKNNACGIVVDKSNKNLIYNNDFIDNKKQALVGYGDSINSTNTWDNGYGDGGNYWSDYAGKDEKSGPDQDQPGSDGIGDTPYVIDKNNRDRYPRMARLVYDVALINVTSSVHTYQGWTVDINATVKNNGNATEDLVVNAYYDNNTIDTATITGLEPGQNVTVTITWNTAGVQLYTEYTIWMRANSVPGENLTEDNILTEKTVTIKIPGDINGDKTVNILDLTVVATAYGTKRGDAKWSAVADLDNNGNINILDLTTIAKEYGQVWPKK